jgi:nicotinamide riboside kinase
VPEYAQTLISAGVADPTALTAQDLEDFARGQHASEDSLAENARRWLICDSDALTTRLYAERLLGTCPAWIAIEATERR